MVYQGSKNKIAKEIIPIIQKEIDNNNIKFFIDAMCGGCNVIDKIKCSTRIALDKNKYLIALYQQALEDDAVFPDHITREDWNSCKNHPEDNPAWKVGLVSFFASYNAKGFIGGFALNSKRDFYNERLRNFRNQLPLLQGVLFGVRDILEPVPTITDSVIYLDPPYKNTKKYDISKDFDYDKFWERARELSKDNIVLVSEQTTPPDFEILWEKEVTRNCFNSSVKAATEKLVKLKSQ